MSIYIWMLVIVMAGIVAYSLYYTLVIARSQKTAKEFDAPIHEKVQERPYLRNPIFISYIVLAVVFILYCHLLCILMKQGQMLLFVLVSFWYSGLTQTIQSIQ